MLQTVFLKLKKMAFFVAKIHLDMIDTGINTTLSVEELSCEWELGYCVDESCFCVEVKCFNIH